MIEIREDDRKVQEFIGILDDEDARQCVEAERSLLAALEGGCQVPIGVFAKSQKNQMTIKAGVFSLDGKKALRAEVTGDKLEAVDLGRRLADSLFKKGAKQILDEVLKDKRM